MTQDEIAGLKQVIVEQGEQSRRLVEVQLERMISQSQRIAEGHAIRVAKLGGLLRHLEHEVVDRRTRIDLLESRSSS